MDTDIDKPGVISLANVLIEDMKQEIKRREEAGLKEAIEALDALTEQQAIAAIRQCKHTIKITTTR